MLLLQFFTVVFFSFSHCFAMEPATGFVEITFKDFEFKAKEVPFKRLKVSVDLLESFDTIKNLVDSSPVDQNFNKNKCYKKVFKKELNNLPGIKRTKKSQYQYLNTFVNFSLCLQKSHHHDDYCEVSDYCKKEDLDCKDCIAIGLDLDYLRCTKGMAECFANFFCDQGYYPFLRLDDKKSELSGVLNFIEGNAFSIANLSESDRKKLLFSIHHKLTRDGDRADFSGKGFRTLKGIELLNGKELCTLIDVSKNKLTTIDIEAIRKYFPNCVKFRYRKNPISIVTKQNLDELSAIKSKTCLNLEGCKIDSFPVGHLKSISKVWVILEGNRLPEETVQKIYDINSARAFKHLFFCTIVYGSVILLGYYASYKIASFLMPQAARLHIESSTNYIKEMVAQYGAENIRGAMHVLNQLDLNGLSPRIGMERSVIDSVVGVYNVNIDHQPTSEVFVPILASLSRYCSLKANFVEFLAGFQAFFGTAVWGIGVLFLRSFIYDLKHLEEHAIYCYPEKEES